MRLSVAPLQVMFAASSGPAEAALLSWRETEYALTVPPLPELPAAGTDRPSAAGYEHPSYLWLSRTLAC